jgi:hypothetical protein
LRRKSWRLLYPISEFGDAIACLSRGGRTRTLQPIELSKKQPTKRTRNASRSWIGILDMRAHQRPNITGGVATATGRLTKPSAVPFDRIGGIEARTLPVAWLRHTRMVTLQTTVVNEHRRTLGASEGFLRQHRATLTNYQHQPMAMECKRLTLCRE